MRAVVITAWFVLLLFGSGPPALAQLANVDAGGLTNFATRLGLRDIAGFVETVQALRAQHRLPPRYVTKDAARAHGWRGGGLCEAWPGHVIGGDVFNNFSGALPGGPAGVYHEADIDSDCRSRGARRLIFADDGRVYLTLDHYKTFQPVP